MLKKLCQCIGLSSLILVMDYSDLLGGGTDVRMHLPFSLAGVCLAQIADILLLGLVLFAVAATLQRTRFYDWLRLLMALVIPPYLLERMGILIPFNAQGRLVVVFAIVWTGLILLLYLKSPRWYRQLFRVGDVAGVFIFFFALCSIAQLLWLAQWKPGPQQHTVSWATTPQPPRVHPKLVWIVFDELSYDQLFEHRAHGLQLPNFDAFRSQSTLFTNVQPSGYKTVKILPSLLTGRTIDDFRFNFQNDFKVHYAGVHGWHLLNGSQTVFADAQKNGWRTGLVGWYNPYCTTYAGTIDDCYFMNLDSIVGDMAVHRSFWHNSQAPFLQMAHEIESPERAGRDSCTFEVRQHYQTHIDLEKHSLQLLRTDQADLIFLHVGIPHSPNIWRRIDNGYTQSCGSSYLDSDNYPLAPELAPVEECKGVGQWQRRF